MNNNFFINRGKCYVERSFNKLNYFKEHQKTKLGTIILVTPEGNHPRDPDGAVYFEDGSIMGKWQREDYSEFRKYINKEVEIIYGEISIPHAQSFTERMLFDIILV